jgi:hypothetical protein
MSENEKTVSRALDQTFRSSLDDRRDCQVHKVVNMPSVTSNPYLNTSVLVGYLLLSIYGLYYWRSSEVHQCVQPHYNTISLVVSPVPEMRPI